MLNSYGSESASTSSHGSPPIPISIISNSQLLREGLAALLARHLNLQLIGSYAGPADAPISLPKPTGHIVLLDANLGQHNALAWTTRWCNIDPPAHVIVLEITQSADQVLMFVEAGACGYTLQGASSAEVAAAIRAALRGEANCSPAIVARLFARLATGRAQSALPVAGLTERELEVLRYLVGDYSNQEIASALVIEVRTVKHHVHHILEKLKVHSRYEAALLAVERGWMPREEAADA